MAWSWMAQSYPCAHEHSPRMHSPREVQLFGQIADRKQSGGSQPAEQAQTPSSQRPWLLQSDGHRAELPTTGRSATSSADALHMRTA